VDGIVGGRRAIAYLDPMTTNAVTAVRDAYRRLQEQIGEAATRVGRRANDVLMIAVTKTATPEQIRTLADEGHRDFGENRVQLLTQRAAQLGEYLSRRRELGEAPEGGPVRDVRWHMIGHLQRNKAKQVVPLVCLIHSVDSLRLADELHAVGAKLDRTIDVLLQVNTSGEPQKYGVAPPAVEHIVEQLQTMVNLRVRGLMTIAPYVEDPEQARPTLARAAELFHEIDTAGTGGEDFNILCMGMSGDFQVAVEEGANVVRIGRALFGEMDREDGPLAQGGESHDDEDLDAPLE